jgi:hypothetical protein
MSSVLVGSWTQYGLNSASLLTQLMASDTARRWSTSITIGRSPRLAGKGHPAAVVVDVAQTVRHSGTGGLLGGVVRALPDGGPVLDQLAHERAGQIKFVKVDVDHSPQLSARFAIQAVPALMIIVDGKIVARQAGAAPAPALRSCLEGALTT